MNQFLYHKKPEILIIDDSPEHILIVSSILKMENYLIRAVVSSSKVFELLQEDVPDLILMDIMMPEINGIELCKMLKSDERYKEIPIIFVTAINDNKTLYEAFDAGAEDYVLKPISVKELLVRVKTHLRLKINQDNLKEAYKEIEAFNHIVSHDLKAPLWSIQKISKYLANAEKSEIDFLTGMMCEKAEEAVHLIDKISEISKMLRSPINLESVNTEKLVDDVYLSIAEDITGRKIELVKEKLPDVLADRTLIKQVFTNIISNAIKFTKNRETAEIKISCKKDKRNYVFSVKDNGAGFDMKFSNKLFNMFQRLHSSNEFSGTGTGLVIVQKIIQRHGGKVFISAEVDKGAMLSFTLPRYR